MFLYYVYIVNKSSSVEVESEIMMIFGVMVVGVYVLVYGIDICIIMVVFLCLDVCMVLMFMFIMVILFRRIRSFVVRVDEVLFILVDYLF